MKNFPPVSDYSLHRRGRGIPQSFRLSKICSKLRYRKRTKIGDILCILCFGKGVAPILRIINTLKS